MADFSTNKNAFRSALQGNNPDLVKEILEWMGGLQAPAPDTTPEPNAKTDDDEIIISHPH
jgi:hypothetical protein